MIKRAFVPQGLSTPIALIVERSCHLKLKQSFCQYNDVKMVGSL